VDGNFEIVVALHGGEEQRQATAAIRAFAKRPIHFTRCYDHMRIRCAHPVDCGMNVAIADPTAGTNDHVRLISFGNTRLCPLRRQSISVALWPGSCAVRIRPSGIDRAGVSVPYRVRKGSRLIFIPKT
jgi:hypothetical protein